MKIPVNVGTLVFAKPGSTICRSGEAGVCYQRYQIGDRPSWGFIFETGGYDGFSIYELNLLLTLTDTVCDVVRPYEFSDEGQLERDFQSGFFLPAFLMAKAAQSILP